MNRRNADDNPWKGLGLVSAIGAELAAGSFAGYFLGKLVSGWMENPIWIVIGIVAGFFAGIVGIFYLIKHYIGGNNG